MCSECYMNPCHPCCPNAPEPKAIYKCATCGEGITDGEEFIEYDGEYYHADCICEMTAEELGTIFGFRVEIAQEEER